MALIPKHGAVRPPMTREEWDAVTSNDVAQKIQEQMDWMRRDGQRIFSNRYYNTESAYIGGGLMSGEELRIRMIAMRLRLKEGEDIPFQRLATAETPDTVFVFVVHNDKYVVLEDDPNLFPSDTLVTQLRLLT